jgi:hypothetical protein
MDKTDVIPEPDPDFDIWQLNFITMIEGNTTTWLIPADNFTALKAKQTGWNTAYAKAKNLRTRSTADVQDKNDARAVYEKALRGFIAEHLAFNSKVTDGDRERLQIRVHTGARTPVGIPGTFPVGSIDASTNQRHKISVVDSETKKKGKPAGVHGFEIWRKVGGDPPTDDKDYTYVVTDTRSPHTIEYGLADIGKKVYYRFRWVNSKGQAGPWSNLVSAIVIG